MGRVPTFLDVGTFIKIAATVAVALLAYGAMASPAWAQDTTLHIETSADPDPAGVEQRLNYTIVVTNTGNEPANDVEFADEIDLGNVTIAGGTVSGTSNEGSCLVVAKTNLSCTFSTLAPGEKATVFIQLTPTSTGTITNTATVTADNALTVNDITSTQVVHFITTLSVEKSADPDPVEVGQELTYTIVVTNTGTVNVAPGVNLKDVIDLGDVTIAPDSLTASTTLGTCLVSPPTTVFCAFGNLAPGEKATVTIKLTPTSAGTITNTATANGLDVAPVKDVITTTVVSDLAGGPEPGENPSGGRVLVDHKGKELCLPEAALKGHEGHGDEVISEEGCSNNPGEEPGEDKTEQVLVDHKGKELCLPEAALNGHLNHGDEVISEEGCSDAKKGRSK